NLQSGSHGRVVSAGVPRVRRPTRTLHAHTRLSASTFAGHNPTSSSCPEPGSRAERADGTADSGALRCRSASLSSPIRGSEYSTPKLAEQMLCRHEVQHRAHGDGGAAARICDI